MPSQRASKLYQDGHAILAPAGTGANGVEDASGELSSSFAGCDMAVGLLTDARFSQ